MDLIHHLTAPITWVNLMPVIGYLAAMTVLVLRGTVWHPIHAIALVAGVSVRLATEGVIVFGSLALALVLFIAMVWSLSKTISATGVLTFAVAIALTPLNALWGLAGGLIVALIVGVARSGLARSKVVGVGALLALGVTPHGLGKPSLDYMPVRPETPGKTLLLPPFFLLGESLAAVVTFLNGG